jgi:hypothetical protein
MVITTPSAYPAIAKATIIARVTSASTHSSRETHPGKENRPVSLPSSPRSRSQSRMGFMPSPLPTHSSTVPPGRAASLRESHSAAPGVRFHGRLTRVRSPTTSPLAPRTARPRCTAGRVCLQSEQSITISTDSNLAQPSTPFECRGLRRHLAALAFCPLSPCYPILIPFLPSKKTSLSSGKATGTQSPGRIRSPDGIVTATSGKEGGRSTNRVCTRPGRSRSM